MDSDELKRRTKKFTIDIILFVGSFPKTVAGYVIGKQLIKCGTSVGANYRAACRGRSKAEFNSKLHIVLEEADERLFWLETIQESNMLENDTLDNLLREAYELTSIFASSYKTARYNPPSSLSELPALSTHSRTTPRQDVVAQPNHQVTKSPNPQITKSLNHQIK